MREQLTWYWRRLRAMSPAEIAGRSRRTAAHRVDDLCFRVAPRIWRATWYPDVAAAPEVQRPIGFLTAERAAAVREGFEDDAEALVERADRLLEGRVQFFGYPEVSVSPERGLDVDPFSGWTWPQRQGKRIDYRRAPADPKWIWELNRCQDLPVLTAAWLLTDKDVYAQTATARLLSWIDGHPPGRGIAWSNGFEAGIRAVALALTIDAFRGSRFLAAEQLDRALVSLWQHGRWIQRDPATGSSANNHRIGELVGHLAIACLAPELDTAARWRGEAVRELAQEVDRQIRTDGTSAEQSFAYHVFVLDLLLVAVALLDATGTSVPQPIAAAIVRSGDALWAQLDDDEPSPAYGDADDGRAVVLDARALRDPRGVAAAIAARFEHPKAARAARGADATTCWLFGSEGVARFRALEPAPPPGSVTLADCGLTILRSGRCRTTFDHGPHGYLSIAAHGHADALRIEVSLGAAELVVDPGVGSYFGLPAYRRYFRGTAAHATVAVDGLDSSTPGGPFLWTHSAKARLLFADLAVGSVVAEHNGSERLGQPVAHRRAVVLIEESVLVLDRLESKASHNYSQGWPLHPALDLERQSDCSVIARGGDSGVVLAFAASRPLVLDAARGETDPLVGWWSERLESVTPAWRIAANVSGAGIVQIATWVIPFERASAPPAEVTLDEGAADTRVQVAGERGSAVVEIPSAGRAPSVRRTMVLA